MRKFEKRVYVEFFVNDDNDLGFKILNFLEEDNDYNRMIQLLARGVVELISSNSEIIFEAGKEAIEKDLQELLKDAIKEKENDK